MGAKEQRSRYIKSWISAVIWNAAIRIEQTLAVKLDERSSKDRIIAIPKDLGVIGFLDPHEVSELGLGLIQRAPNAIRFLVPKARGLQNNHSCGRMLVVIAVMR